SLSGETDATALAGGPLEVHSGGQIFTGAYAYEIPEEGRVVRAQVVASDTRLPMTQIRISERVVREAKQIVAHAAQRAALTEPDLGKNSFALLSQKLAELAAVPDSDFESAQAAALAAHEALIPVLAQHRPSHWNHLIWPRLSQMADALAEAL